MAEAYLIGQIRVRDSAKWAEYVAAVGDTLTPWGAEVVFRGRKANSFSGDTPFQTVVVIRFPTLQAVDDWHASAAYQALIPLRDEAAEVVLQAWEN
ncbi:uncharacterized protein (DUF1330 family) [Alkalispirillum mobile]|uniref:Uncharacterized protein (DUF1330 family) n=1 Tax=Alkalispirillum mobile TaxID=85925 RepID=A0A498CDA0_9GAMM|nr:DUF1330 domain-containing protein [Alkalispirillum mobile]RLK51250.1 uncharacterized protein (DUF1330 family) [Alkalispirillum mobile]